VEYSHDIFPTIKRDMGKTATPLGAVQPSPVQFSLCPSHAAKSLARRLLARTKLSFVWG
jgi:hypothetical protein